MKKQNLRPGLSSHSFIHVELLDDVAATADPPQQSTNIPVQPAAAATAAINPPDNAQASPLQPTNLNPETPATTAAPADAVPVATCHLS
jgi:hypothetical protein